MKLMEDLEKTAETSFEKEIIFEEESFQLSNTQLKLLKDWHDDVGIFYYKL
jgi:hypothetical protein